MLFFIYDCVKKHFFVASCIPIGIVIQYRERDYELIVSNCQPHEYHVDIQNSQL